MKKCAMCGKEKEENEFYTRKIFRKKINGLKEYLTSYCKDCDKKYNKTRRKNGK